MAMMMRITNNCLAASYGSRYAVLLALLLAVVSTIADDAGVDAVADDIPEPCSPKALEQYLDCVADNPCTCANCRDPNDETWVVSIPTPRSCNDIYKTFCDWTKCCSPCEAELVNYHTCLMGQVATVSLGVDHSCTLGACTGDYDDVQGECEPSASPSPPPTLQPPCTREIVLYENCIVEDMSCEFCDTLPLQSLNLGGSCEQAFVGTICPLESCCASCTETYEDMSKCMSNVAFADGDCPATPCLEEADEPSPAPTSPPSLDSFPSANVNAIQPVQGLAEQETTSNAVMTTSASVFLGVAAVVAVWV